MDQETKNNMYKWFADNASTMKMYFLSKNDEDQSSNNDRSCKSDIDLIQFVSDDILFCNVFQYLSPNEVCKFSLTNKYYYKLISSSNNNELSFIGDLFWNQQSFQLNDSAIFNNKKFDLRLNDNQNEKSKLAYLEALLKLTNDEIKHWSNCVNADSALQKFSKTICNDHLKPVKDRTIIGLVCNIGNMPTKEISIAIGERRKYAMYSCLVQNMDSAIQFRRSSCNIHEGLSFMPVSGSTSRNDQMTLEMNYSERDLYYEYTKILPGFIGRAIDLLKLDPEYEFLRYGVLKSMVYRNITVWKNKESLENAVIELAKRKTSIANNEGIYQDIIIDTNLFRNPVFVEKSSNIAINHEEETIVLNPCLVSSPSISISKILERPNIKNPGYDPKIHLEKLQKIKHNLLTSIAWIQYQ